MGAYTKVKIIKILSENIKNLNKNNLIETALNLQTKVESCIIEVLEEFIYIYLFYIQFL